MLSRALRWIVLLILLVVTAPACSHEDSRNTSVETPHGPAVGAPPPLAAVINRSSPASDAFGGFRCAGVLVAPEVVATARHCLRGARPGTVDVIVGAGNLCRGSSIPGERIHVRAVEGPVGPSRLADLALLRLATRAHVPPADIAPTSGRTELAAYGWGRYQSRFSCTPEVALLATSLDSDCTKDARLLPPTVAHLCARDRLGEGTPALVTPADPHSYAVLAVSSS